ncbi:MAG: hypothetical protein U5L06_14880, partial [Rhodovibrio sp.]|nr:hypothetical protein [Rhodovibrio sp.]
ELETEQAAFRDVQAHGREALAQVADELGVSVGTLDEMLAASDRFSRCCKSGPRRPAGRSRFRCRCPGMRR